jgi:hypothetical protein
MERNPVAGLYARRDEAVRGTVRQRMQVIERERAVADNESYSSAEPLRGDREDLADGARRRNHSFIRRDASVASRHRRHPFSPLSVIVRRAYGARVRGGIAGMVRVAVRLPLPFGKA